MAGTIEILKQQGKLTKGGEDYDIPASKKIIGVYFSAHWCPPCRGFTPTLAEFYKHFTEEDPQEFEIVFVSSDRDQASFDEYFNEMPWAALKFNLREDKDKLAELNGVQGIPTLVIFNSDGQVIDKTARGAVASYKGGAFPFKA